jgi:RNA recognition motif-containing protein
MITEDFLKKNFSDFGMIVNVSMEIEKGRGFVTFSKTEATDRAIVEVRTYKSSILLEDFKFELISDAWKDHQRNPVDGVVGQETAVD